MTFRESMLASQRLAMRLCLAADRLQKAETKYRAAQDHPNVYPTIRHLNLQDMHDAANEVRAVLLAISDGSTEGRADEKPSQKADRPSSIATGASQVSDSLPEPTRGVEAEAGIEPGPSEPPTIQVRDIARIIRVAMANKRDSDTYGVDRASGMNDEVAAKAADAILALLQPTSGGET